VTLLYEPGPLPSQSAIGILRLNANVEAEILVRDVLRNLYALPMDFRLSLSRAFKENNISMDK
jgi:hypothetical protein